MDEYRRYDCTCNHCGRSFEVNYPLHIAEGGSRHGTYDMENARLSGATSMCASCNAEQSRDLEDIRRLREEERENKHPRMP